MLGISTCLCEQPGCDGSCGVPVTGALPPPTLDLAIVSLLAYALKNSKENLECNTLGNMLLSCSRTSYHTDGFPKKPACFELAVPDDWVMNVKGKQDFQDVYVTVRIPIEVFQAWRKGPEPKKLIVEPTKGEVKQVNGD